MRILLVIPTLREIHVQYLHVSLIINDKKQLFLSVEMLSEIAYARFLFHANLIDHLMAYQMPY